MDLSWVVTADPNFITSHARYTTNFGLFAMTTRDNPCQYRTYNRRENDPGMYHPGQEISKCSARRGLQRESDPGGCIQTGGFATINARKPSVYVRGDPACRFP